MGATEDMGRLRGEVERLHDERGVHIRNLAHDVNVMRAGFRIRREENVYLDIVKIIEATR